MNMHFAEGNVEYGRSLLRALSNTGISVLYQDLRLRVTWSLNVPPAWGDGDLIGKTDHEFLPAAEADRLISVKKAVLKSGEGDSLEIRINAEGGACWYEVWVDADRLGESGDIIGIITTAVDISEQKQREQTLRTLLREVSHRSKNLLAIIQSIATQTGRYSQTVEGFLTRFRGRIQSLAASQDLVTSSNWRGADLRELVAGQVGRYAGDPAHAISVEGANPYLNPNAALHIGLALHELAVNSMSGGALSKPDGEVKIRAELGEAESCEAELVLTWVEKVDLASDAELEKRFGTAALERVVPASLNGRSKLRIENGLLTYELFVPKGSFEIE
ncbi:MAG TPA: HWE histidine kinase domain-containing protein [Rhizobiaceae bacterium]|nr:HWE histidine kinase domain-containing protein [Rhizobiaceae bacterium]